MKALFKNSSVFVKALLGVYFVAGLVFALAPEEWFPSFYAIGLMSKLAFVSFFIILLPLFIFRPKNEKEKNALSNLQLSIALALFINGLGGLGLYKLYKIGFQYDKLMHFVTPLILTVVLISFSSIWKGWSNKKAVIFSTVLVFVGGIAWEFLEFYSDIILGTTLVGLGGNGGAVDTIWDMIFNTLGIVSAVVYFYFKIGSKLQPK